MKLMIRITAIGLPGSGKTRILDRLQKVLEEEGFIFGATMKEMDEFFYESQRSSEERYYKGEERKEPNYRLGPPEL